MANYKYSAQDAGKKICHGMMEGNSPRQVRDKLRRMGMTPLSTQLVKSVFSQDGYWSFFKTRLGSTDLAMVTRQLSTLIRAGQPVAESLKIITHQATNAPVKTIFADVHSRIQDGYSLAAALGGYPAVFDPVFRETIAAGEQAGRLPLVLERLADHLEEKDQLRKKVVAAMIYPMVVTLFALLVVGVLLIHVVPQFLRVFADANTPLPPLTQLLLSTSSFIGSHWLVLVLATITLWLGVTLLLRQPKVGWYGDLFWLKWPLIGQLIRDSNVAGFSRTLATLLASGVPLVDGLTIASRVVTNRPMQNALLKVTTRVREGGRLAPSLDEAGFFPPILIHLVASGEVAGNLAEILDRAATFQEGQVSSKVTVLSSLFEPLLVVLLGGFVLVIVVAILLPIFELNHMVHF